MVDNDTAEDCQRYAGSSGWDAVVECGRPPSATILATVEENVLGCGESTDNRQMVEHPNEANDAVQAAELVECWERLVERSNAGYPSSMVAKRE